MWIPSHLISFSPLPMQSNPMQGRATLNRRAKAGNGGTKCAHGAKGNPAASRGRLPACQDGQTMGPEVGSSQQSQQWMCYLALQPLSSLLDQQQKQTATAAAYAPAAAAAASAAAAAEAASQQHQQQQEQQRCNRCSCNMGSCNRSWRMSNMLLLVV